MYIVIDILSVQVNQVSQQAGIPYKEAEAIQRALLSQFSVFPVSCRDLLEEMKHTAVSLPTGVYIGA